MILLNASVFPPPRTWRPLSVLPLVPLLPVPLALLLALPGLALFRVRAVGLLGVLGLLLLLEFRQELFQVAVEVPEAGVLQGLLESQYNVYVRMRELQTGADGRKWPKREGRYVELHGFVS
jgi:hypothetical protein